MGRLSRNNSAHTQRKIEQTDKGPRIGRVIEVFEHQSSDDNSNFEVDVLLLGEEKQHRSIPYLSTSSNEISVPRAGDKVIVEYRGGAKSLPIARGAAFTNEDRPPLGNAGTWRRKIDSGSSPAGDGDLYVESYTKYAENPATTNPNDTTAERSFIRLAKKVNDDDDPDDGDALPVSIELIDDPNGDASDVFIRLNKKDGSDTSQTWGLRFNLKTGEFKALDADGYGIVSNGAGDFTWYHENIDFNEGSTTSL